MTSRRRVVRLGKLKRTWWEHGGRAREIVDNTAAEPTLSKASTHALFWWHQPDGAALNGKAIEARFYANVKTMSRYYKQTNVAGHGGRPVLVAAALRSRDAGAMPVWSGGRRKTTAITVTGKRRTRSTPFSSSSTLSPSPGAPITSMWAMTPKGWESSPVAGAAAGQQEEPTSRPQQSNSSELDQRGVRPTQWICRIAS